MGAIARDDVVTCRLDDAVEAVRPRVEQSPYRFALVTTEDGIVLGCLRMSAMDGASADATAEAVMEPGPSTVRPDVEVAKLAARLDERKLRTGIVTTPDGRLLGAVLREWLEQ